MNRNITYQSLFGLVLIVSLLAGCEAPPSLPTELTSPTSVLPAPTSTTTPDPTPLPPEHRISVRVVDGTGEFYDRLTGEKFIPRGNNYIRLAPQTGFSGGTFTYHATFNVGLYNPELAEEVLQKMHENGYNVVRVFVNGNCKTDCIGDADNGLSHAYIANVVDFLQKAKENGIFVIITTDAEPATAHYSGLLSTTWSESFGGTNTNYLTEGGVLVGKEFWQDFIEELHAQEGALDAIFAYELRNELFFETNAAPFTLTSGTVRTANGNSYDVGSEDERQRMLDENLVYWIDQIHSAILERDPTALVTVGFFPPDSPNSWPSAPRFIRTSPAVWQSSIDFIDFHPYPGGYTLDKLVENLGMIGFEEKPIIMGEFGASRSSYPSAAKAAQALHDWEVESCKFGFDGWLLWTWDSDEQTDFYNGLGDESPISQALSPINRPDPCQPGDFPFFEFNLALGKPVIASKSLPENPASAVVDGVTTDWWGAGDFATQWIEIDLETPMTIGKIRLVTSQSPEGNTRHQIWVGSSRDSLELLHTFEGFTTDLQLLEFNPETPLTNIRYVRVVTRESPSWIGWREVEVLAP